MRKIHLARIAKSGKVYLATFVLALIAGCATGHVKPRGPAVCNGSVLRVESDHWEDVTIYIERAGNRQRVGRVSAMRSEKFCLQSGVMGTRVSFVIVPLGTRGTRVYDDMDVVPIGSFSYRLRDQILYDNTLKPVLWLAPQLEFSTIRYSH